MHEKGKIERWHKSLKRECIREKVPLSKEDTERVITGYVDYYNNERLRSAIGYFAPKHKLTGMEKIILAARDQKLEDARELRKLRPAEAKESSYFGMMNHFSGIFSRLI